MGLAPIGFEMATPYVQNGLQLYFDYGIKECYVGTGTTLNDLSGNNVTGMGLTNSPSYSNGFITFNGTNQYVSDFNYGTKFTGSTFSYVGILTPSSTKGNYMNLMDTVNSINPMVWFTSAVKIEIDQASCFTSPLSYSGGTYQVCFTHSNTTGIGAKLYVNGQYIGGNTAAQGSIANNAVLNLYRRASSGTLNYKGSAANLMLYNKVLSQDEVTQNYLAFKNRFSI